MKGRQIAKELGLDKSQVNSFLHKNQDTFVKNSNHEWSLIRAHHVEIDFATGWIDDKAFESAIGKLAYQKDANKITWLFAIWGWNAKFQKYLKYPCFVQKLVDSTFMYIVLFCAKLGWS